MSNRARKELKQSNFLINNIQEKTDFFNHSFKNYKHFTRLTKLIDTSFDYGKETTINLSELASEYGDLISNMMIKVTLPSVRGEDRLANYIPPEPVPGERVIVADSIFFGDIVSYTNGIGHALFEYIELRIDDQLIDRHTSEWMDIWSELTIKPGLQKNYNYLVKKFETDGINFFGGDIYLPLHFWFCNNNENKMAFPIGAMYNSKIELKIKIREFHLIFIALLPFATEIHNPFLFTQGIPSMIERINKTYNIPTNITNSKLIIDYILLDKESSKQLKNTKEDKKYLITQVQQIEQPVISGTHINKIPYKFRSSTKYLYEFKYSFKSLKYNITELIWIIKNKKFINDYSAHFAYGDKGFNTDLFIQNRFRNIKITINNNNTELIESHTADYFRSIEPLSIHDNTPFNFIHCYSFALNPENYSTPSGTFNFNKIQNIQFNFTLDEINDSNNIIYLYAINYNVLKIKNGRVCLLNDGEYICENDPDNINNNDNNINNDNLEIDPNIIGSSNIGSGVNL